MRDLPKLVHKDPPDVGNPKMRFRDDTDKKRAISEFNYLKTVPGWQRIVRFLEDQIKYYDKLLTDGKIETIEELKLIRAKRNRAIQTKNLPDILTEKLQLEGGEIEFDPYD